MKRSISRLGTLALILALTSIGSSAHAYIADDDACGSAPAGWNAPNGAAVSSRQAVGPITDLMDAIGEFYSHQMLSHGPGSTKWISHSTMKNPGVEVSVFGNDDFDYNDLVAGYPGPSQINMGAAYHMLYRGAGATVRYVSGGSTGAKIADWFWSSLPYCGNVSSGPCYTGVYSQESSSYYLYIIGRKQNGTTYRHSYGLFQYQNDKSVPNGDDTSSISWAQHCSTFMAWGLHLVTGQTISSKTYYNSVVGPAAYILHSAVSDECDDSAGWFGGLFVNCDDLADQLVNCFTAEINGAGICDNDSSSVWKNFATNGTAVSVSPDRIVGNNGNGGGPWATNPEYTVYFNQGGSVYGCFF